MERYIETSQISDSHWVSFLNLSVFLLIYGEISKKANPSIFEEFWVMIKCLIKKLERGDLNKLSTMC